MARPTLPVPETSVYMLRVRLRDARRSLRRLRKQLSVRTLLEDELADQVADLRAQLARHRNARTVAARKARQL